MNDEKLRGLAARHGTPLYVFDERELVSRVERLRALLPRTVKMCYAVKANTFVLPALAGLIDRFEVCSPGEYRICDAVGLAASDLVISGVHKDAATVGKALSGRLPPAAVTVESSAQLDLIARTAGELGARAPVLIRLTSGNQFGLDRGDLIGAIERFRDDARIDLRGVQYFSGTQKTSLRRLGRELARLDALMADLERDLGWRAPELEYGPGLPVSYFKADDFDEDAFVHEFSTMLGALSFTGGITLEIGRSLVASCGTYLTRIVDAKVNAGQRYAIVDGGMHQLVYYGQSMAMKQPRAHLLAGGADGAPGEALPWNICGSLCTINDILAKQLPLAGPAVGDILAFEMTGAYAVTEGMSLFLSRDLPAVVSARRDGGSALLRAHRRCDELNTPQTPEPVS